MTRFSPISVDNLSSHCGWGTGVGAPVLQLRSGTALRHFQRTVKLSQHQRVYRNWHPLEELHGGKGGS